MEARVKWVEGLRFIGGSGTGHGVIMDASATADGEQRLGPSPMEMLLLGLGGCTTYDVVSILKKMREPVDDVTVDITSERADEAPKVFTKIHAAFTVIGTGVSLAKAEEAVKLSADKYCSASIMLGKTAEITHSVAVQETEAK
jgi:putative redox protein